MTRLRRGSQILVAAVAIGLLAGCAAPAAADKTTDTGSQESGPVGEDASAAPAASGKDWLVSVASATEGGSPTGETQLIRYNPETSTASALMLAPTTQVAYGSVTIDHKRIVTEDESGTTVQVLDLESGETSYIDPLDLIDDPSFDLGFVYPHESDPNLAVMFSFNATTGGYDAWTVGLQDPTEATPAPEIDFEALGERQSFDTDSWNHSEYGMPKGTPGLTQANWDADGERLEDTPATTPGPPSDYFAAKEDGTVLGFSLVNNVSGGDSILRTFSLQPGETEWKQVGERATISMADPTMSWIEWMIPPSA